MCASQAGVSTTVPVTSPVKLVKHGPTPVQSVGTWGLIYPLLKLKRKMCIFSTDTMVIRRGLVWMTSQQKDYSPGWMAVQINSASGPRNNRTTLRGRTAYTPLVLDMDTHGMTWTVLHVISILVKKAKMRSINLIPPFFPSFTVIRPTYILKERKDTLCVEQIAGRF